MDAFFLFVFGVILIGVAIIGSIQNFLDTNGGRDTY